MQFVVLAIAALRL